MKISKTQLKKIIKEEISKVLSERMPRRPGYGKLPGIDQSGWDSGYDVWTEMAEAIRNLMKKGNHIFNTIVEGNPSDDEIERAASLYQKLWERYGGSSRRSALGSAPLMDMLYRVANPSDHWPEANKKFVEHIREMAKFTGGEGERDEYLGTPLFIT